jgi:hypothetical protein
MSEQNGDKRQMVQAQYPLSERYQTIQYASSPIRVCFCMRDAFSLLKGLLLNQKTWLGSEIKFLSKPNEAYDHTYVLA